MHVVFLGPPACGKGTQSKLLVKKKGFRHLSTGDLIRSECNSGSECGEKIKSTINTGKLVDSNVVNTLVQKSIENSIGISVLFDGYPRTVDQAIFIDGILEKKGEKIGQVFYFDVDQDELLSRILNRFSCGDCGAVYNSVTNTTRVDGVCDFCGGKNFIRRNDDTESVLKDRILSYYAETEPLKVFYQQRDILTVVDAKLPVELVTEQILNAF